MEEKIDKILTSQEKIEKSFVTIEIQVENIDRSLSEILKRTFQQDDKIVEMQRKLSTHSWALITCGFLILVLFATI